MDLNIKDVAELLNVSETTIEGLLSNGKIPAYRIHDQYRFSRIEIQDWVMQKKNEASPFEQDAKTGTQQFSLYRGLHKGSVFHDVPGHTKEEVIRTTMQLMAMDLHLDADVLTDLLLDRESMQPTSLDHGIAVPHTRDFLLNAHFDVVTIAFPKEPINYGALDGQPVHTLFFLFACEDKRHLHLLAKIAHLSSHKASYEFLKSRPNKAKLLEYVKEWERHIN